MLESLKLFLSEMGVLWGKVGINQKIALAVLISLLVGGLFFWGSWNTRDDFGLLFKGVEQKDAGEIVNILKSENISFRLADGGTTILVPSDKVYDLRLKLAGQGLPREDAGWSLFDQNRLGGLSDFVQQVNHTRALQAELERTISRLKQIEWAKVHIVETKETLFTDHAQPATASVLLKTRGGASLSENQIAGITHLISGAVRSLDPGKVTITDHSGRVLSRPAESDGASLASNQLDYRRRIEEHLSTRATQMLEKVLGPGKAVVTVSADVDFTTSEKRIIDYKDKVQKSTMETTRENSYPSASGEAGVSASAAGGAGAGTSTTREEKVEFLPPIPTTEEKRLEPGGKVTRLAAAVFVCAGDYKTTKAADGAGARQYASVSSDKLKEYESIVKNAIGYVERRDSLTISDGEFRSSVPVAPEELQVIQQQSSREFILGLVKSGSTALGVLLFLFFARRVLKKGFAAAEVQPRPQPRPQPQLQPQLQPQTAGVGTIDVISLQRQEEEELVAMNLKEQVVASVKQDPDKATQYLRTWLYK